MPPTDRFAVSPDRSVVLRYAGAAMAALAALGLRMVLDPIMGMQAPYLPFVLAIIVVSRYGGFGPGLAVTGLGALAVDWFYLQPRSSLAIGDPSARAALALFVLTGIIVSFLVGRLRKPIQLQQTEERIHLSPGSTAASRGADRKVKPHHLWLGAAVLLLAIESLLFVGTWTRFAERESLSLRTRDVLARIESLLSELKDAETGQRGYLLSGQDSYLEPYNAAVQAIPGQLEDLRRTTLDPGQQARIASLRPLIGAKLAELKETIDLRQSGAASAALQVLSSHRGKQLMDQIRDAMAAMRVAEASLLDERSQSAAAAARGIGVVMASGAGLLLIVLLAGSRDIDRNLKRRQRAQQELRVSERKFAQAFATNPAALAIAGIDEGVIIEVNDAWQAIVGHTRDEAIGRSASELHTWQTPEDSARYARELREKGSIGGREVTLLRKSGEPLTALLSAVILPGADQAALWAWLDITERKRAEEALRESEKRYRNLFESMDEGFAECEMIYDAEGRPVDYRHLALNPAFSTVTGLAVENVVGRTVSEAIPNIEPFWIESYGRVVRTGESERIANPVAALGRQFELFVWRSGPGRFAVVLSDVTERKRAEEALLRMSAMVESSDDAIIGKTLEGAITSWNLGAVRLYGYTAPEVIGRNISVLVPAGHSDETAAILRRLAKGERIEQLEAVRRKKDGSLVDVSLKISPIMDASGNVVGASTIARDMTERKRAEDEVRRLNAELEDRVRQRTAQLEAANKELEAFAYSVSHDLRAPLRGIDGWSLALVEDYAGQLDERAHGYLARVRAETQRMGTLIDDLLQLSRVTRSQMASGAVDLTAIAQTIAARLTGDHSGRRIEFTIAGGLAANGDARLLEIALDNLFSNAVKFTGPRAEPRIEFGRTERDRERPFYVRDNGVGFDMAFAGTLFGAFQRLHKTTEFPGTGIGLATVQRIIHRHGGRVWAEAQPDRGATFYFTLGGP
jgi:PAS domain S-box-containing protein